MKRVSDNNNLNAIMQERTLNYDTVNEFATSLIGGTIQQNRWKPFHYLKM